MTPEIDGARWDNFQRLEHKSYYLATGSKLRDDGRADWRGTHTYLQAFSGLLMGYFDMACIPLYVHCAFRDKLAQDAMRQTGMSKLGWPLSGHNRGYAVDIVHGRFAWDLTRREWNAIGAVGKRLWDAYMQKLPSEQRLEIEWGGDWSNPWDPAHWEIKGFQKLAFNSDAAEVYNSDFMPARFTRKQLLAKARDHVSIISAVDGN